MLTPQKLLRGIDAFVVCGKFGAKWVLAQNYVRKLNCMTACSVTVQYPEHLHVLISKSMQGCQQFHFVFQCYFSLSFFVTGWYTVLVFTPFIVDFIHDLFQIQSAQSS